MSSRRAFTLIELLVVIAIIAILAVVVVLVLNPVQLLTQAQDASRVADASTINKAIGLYILDGNTSLGSAGVIYTSLPDPTATSTAGTNCSGVTLPIMTTSTDTYHCAASSTYRAVNGTGWIPLNFASSSEGGAPFGTLPVDPVNSGPQGLYYMYITNGSTYELLMHLASSKYQSIQQNDGGQYADLYETGSNLALAPLDFYSSKNPYILSFDTAQPYPLSGSATGTYTLANTANQTTSIYLAVPSNCNIHYSLLAPNGTYLQNNVISCGNPFYWVENLSSVGTYSLIIAPPSGTSYNATISIATTTTGSPIVNYATGTLQDFYGGQIAQDPYSGTAGQQIDIYVGNISSCYTFYQLYTPTGTSLFSQNSCGGYFDLSNLTLPVTGNYVFQAVPQGGVVFDSPVMISQPVTGTMPLNTTTTITTHYPAQTAEYTFSGTASSTINFFLNGFVGCNPRVYVYNPDGTTLINDFLSCNSSAYSGTTTLPQNGTYTVELYPNSQTSFSVQTDLIYQ